MSRNVLMQELLVGVEGLALLRHLYDGDDDATRRRLTEVRELMSTGPGTDGEPIREAEARDGYDLWAAGYDEPGNPIIELEEPAVRSLIDGVAPSSALDAACGTGRHARHLADLGHQVLGFDLSPAMLAVAAAKVPEARFLEGDLLDIPAEPDRFDVVVCGLALGHVPDVSAAVAALARVLRPGGQLVISVLHPFQAQLGWHAPFTDAHGERRFVRERPHSHADYVQAFRSAGLDVTDCLEPALREEHLRSKRRAFERIPEATVAAFSGLPGVLVWRAVKRPQAQRQLPRARNLL